MTEPQQYYETGFQFLTKQSYTEARDNFLKAIEMKPDWASPYLGLGQTFLFQKNRDLKRAAEAFSRVVALKPDWVEGHHWLGTAQEELGNLDQAVEAYRHAIRIDSRDTRPLIAMGVCMTRLRRFTDAIDCLRRAIALNPPYAVASAHLFLADALKEAGRIDAACKEWEAVLQLPSVYPEHGSAKDEAQKLLNKHRGSSRGQRHKR